MSSCLAINGTSKRRDMTEISLENFKKITLLSPKYVHFFLKMYISKLSWQYICFKNFETYISYHILFKDGEKRKQYLLFCNPLVKEGLTIIAAKAISGKKNYYFPKNVGLAWLEHCTKKMFNFWELFFP